MKGATAQGYAKPLHEAGAATMMFLSSPTGHCFQPDHLRRLLCLVRQLEGPHVTQASLMFLSTALWQGLTLVHFSAQRKRFLWERGCVYGVSGGN